MIVIAGQLNQNIGNQLIPRSTYIYWMFYQEINYFKQGAKKVIKSVRTDLLIKKKS